MAVSKVGDKEMGAYIKSYLIYRSDNHTMGGESGDSNVYHCTHLDET